MTLTIDGKRVKVQIWDTAGQERFRNITQNYYRKAQGTLLVYDVTNRESFKSVDGWMTTIQQHAGDSINKILVGNKLDCEAQRVVQTHEGEALSKKYNIKFFETSAKTQQNVTGAPSLLLSLLSLLSLLPPPLLFSLPLLTSSHPTHPITIPECFEAIATECYKRQLTESSQVTSSAGVQKLTAQQNASEKKKGCC